MLKKRDVAEWCTRVGIRVRYNKCAHATLVLSAAIWSNAGPDSQCRILAVVDVSRDAAGSGTLIQAGQVCIVNRCGVLHRTSRE